jgi:signal transduction histidine kinase
VNGSEGDDDLAHALRTPLTVMLGYLDLLRGELLDLDDEARARMLALIDLHARRLLAVVEGLTEADRSARTPQ